MTRASPQEDLYSGASCTRLQSFCDTLNLSNNCYSQILGITDLLGRKVRDVQGRGAEQVEREREDSSHQMRY